MYVPIINGIKVLLKQKFKAKKTPLSIIRKQDICLNAKSAVIAGYLEWYPTKMILMM
jgi:hypothetical protein